MKIKAGLLFVVFCWLVFTTGHWMWNDFVKIDCQAVKDRVFMTNLCKKDTSCTVSVDELMMFRRAERKLLACSDISLK